MPIQAAPAVLTLADLQATLQAIPDLLFEMSETGDYLRVWARQPALLADQEQALLGRNVHEVLSPEAARTVIHTLATAVREGMAQGDVIRIDLADGPHWFEHSAAPKPAVPGEPRSVMLLSRDITARMRAEAQVRDTAVRLGLAMGAAGMGAWDFDFATDTLRWSDEIFELFGLAPQPVSRELIQGFIHPEDRDVPEAAMQQAIATRTPYRAQYRVLQGEQVEWVEDRGAIQFGPDGAPLRVIGVAQKITERKVAEAELERHRRQLESLVKDRTEQLMVEKVRAEAANRAKSAFLANMSHEIRTPLNAISGMAWLMRREGLTPRQTDRLEKIEGAGRQLLASIDAILDLSKIEAGRTSLEAVPLDLAALMQRTVAELAERAQAKGLTLRTELPPQAPALLGDPARLRQLLVNFGANALKFTEAGEVTLRVRVAAEDAEAITLHLEVQDTGSGIAPEALPRLFEPFEQGDNSITRRHGGSGLGLAINKGLAELMGGQVGAQNLPEGGSRFWATVRLARAA